MTEALYDLAMSAACVVTVLVIIYLIYLDGGDDP